MKTFQTAPGDIIYLVLLKAILNIADLLMFFLLIQQKELSFITCSLGSYLDYVKAEGIQVQFIG